MNIFDKLIKIGVTFPKSKVKLPKNWPNIKSSIYNNEKNFAVLTGKINDIIVIDLDNKDSEFKAKLWFEDNIGKLESINTLVTKTINNGYHIFFKYNPKIINRNNYKEINIDILSDKKCCYQGEHYDIIYNNEIRELTEIEIGKLVYDNNNECELNDNELNSELNEINTNEAEIEFVLNHLKKERSEDYNSWRNVGFALVPLKNGKEMFRRFSLKSDKYNESEFEKTWKSYISTDYTGDKITIKTLFSYLKKDNPEKFKQLNKFSIEKQFKVEHMNGKLKDIKYEKNIVKAKVLENDSIDLSHIKHNSKICKGDLFYNIEISDVLNQIKTNVTCNKCGFVHGEKQCMAPNIYQLVLNYNNVQENLNELKLVISPENQLTIHSNKKINDLLYDSLKQKDITICEILYEMFKDSYILIKNTWYKYNGVIWKEVEDEMYPKELLFGINDIESYITKLYEKHNYENNLIDEQLKKLSKICNNMSTKMTKNNEDISYTNASKKYFSKPGLKFNEQTHLLAFQNGIYDLKTFKFRKGVPEDYISIQLNYDYNDNIDMKKMKFIEQFLNDILPIETVKDFLLINIASCLLGDENKEQEFYILTGKKGANGKSVLTKLIENVFGFYFAGPEPTLITKQREKANEANEALMDLVGKRIAIMSEPNRKDRILSDNLKKFTGGDTITVRGIHKSSQKLNMFFKIFMLCNSIPLLDDCKEAEIRRLCIIDFPTRFCENPLRKNEKPIDLNISKKLNECLNEFFHLLIIYLKKYNECISKGKKLIKPKEVTKKLEEYIQKNNDDIDAYEFIDTYLEYDNKSDKMYCDEIWKLYKNWCIQESKPKIKRNDLEDLIEMKFELDEKSLYQNRYIWKNIKFKECE